MPFAAKWMDLEIIRLSEISQKQKDKYQMILLIGGILKNMQINLYTKWKQICRQKDKLMVTKGESG